MTSRVFHGEVVKRYIGQHKVYGDSVKDGYLGSGKLLTLAIRKHGRACFSRETLEVCYSQMEMDTAEKKWITAFCAVESPYFYNLAEGGSVGVPERKVVYKYELDGSFIGEFKSVAEAAALHGVECPTITTSIRKGGTGAGFQWRFEKFETIEPTKIGNYKEVSCYSLMGEFVRDFSNGSEAALFFGKSSPANIFSACAGKRLASCGHQWKYKDSNKKITSCHNRKPIANSRKLLQINSENLEVINTFDSINDAGRHIGCNPQTLATAAAKRYVSQGFQWKYADDERPVVKIRLGKKVIRPVYQFKGCSLTQEFPSLSAAAEAVDSCTTNIVRAIRNNFYCKGYRWQYADP